MWIIDENGGKTKGYAQFTPRFLMQVKEEERYHVENVARQLRCTVSREWIYKTEIYSGKQLPVLGVSTPDTLHFKEVVRRFESGFPYYVFFNSDLTPVQMFLYERDLFPLAFGEYMFEDDMLVSVELQDKFDAMDYTVPPLSTMVLKPGRTDAAPKYQRSLTLEIGYDEREYLVEVETVEEALTELNAHILRCDPDVILSQYGDDTFLPLLTEWARKARIPLYLNRDSSAADMRTAEVSYWTYGKIVHRSAGFQLAGRWHIDMENSFILGESELAGLLDLSRITRIPVQKQARTSIGTGLSSMQLNWAYQHNILIPAKKQEWEKFKSALTLLYADRGGLIYLPVMGYHEQVAELDFTSMYPTIMYIHNVSPETVNCDCCRNDSVPELHYTICEKRQGIIPETIGAVLRKRAEYKRREKNATSAEMKKEFHERQTALKWMLVTTFGYLGYKNARFGKIEAHESVNAFARDALLHAKRIAEDRGFSVIHGIVDCLWLKKSGATMEDYEKLCDEILSQTGIHISLEGIYKWILFPESRMDPAIPTANRYVGAYTNGEVKVRGLEVRRHDTPKFVREMQGEAIELMSKASGIEELRNSIPSIMDVVRSRLDLLRSGKVSPIDLIIRRTISKDADEYENNSVQAVVARTMSEAGVALKPGETAEYIIIDHTGKKNPVKAKPFIFHQPEDGYDVEKYTELALESIEILLEPLGYAYEMIEEMAGMVRKKKMKKEKRSGSLNIPFEQGSI